MRVSTSNLFTSTWRDGMGIVASVGCAIHCAAMPFVIAYLPSLGLSFLADEAFHKWMFLVCAMLGLLAFLPGWRKHGRWSPLTIGSVGLVLIGFAAFGLAGECCSACELEQQGAVDTELNSPCCENGCCQHSHSVVSTQASESESGSVAASFVEAELLSRWAPWITPVGGICLICAHLLNRRFGCSCGCCPSVAESF